MGIVLAHDLPLDQVDGADLTGADLRGAQLQEADLSGTDLSGADLSNTVTFGTDFTRALLMGTRVPHGIRLFARSLTMANVYGVRDPLEGFVDWAIRSEGAVCVWPKEEWPAVRDGQREWPAPPPDADLDSLCSVLH